MKCTNLDSLPYKAITVKGPAPGFWCDILKIGQTICVTLRSYGAFDAKIKRYNRGSDTYVMSYPDGDEREHNLTLCSAQGISKWELK